MARMNTANPVQIPQRMEVGKMGGSGSNDSCGDARREKCFDAGDSYMISKRGRQSKHIVEENLIILREIAYEGTHCAVQKDARAVPDCSRKRFPGTRNSP